VSSTILRRASISPGALTDVVICEGRIASAAPRGARSIDLEGRPLLPGLGDHHLHLMAQAAAWQSVDCTPPALAGGGLAAALRAARELRPGGWLRGVGYDVATCGLLERDLLDSMGAGPVRIQDRTGTLWMLDTLAMDLVLPEDDTDWPAGIERDAAGRPTGVLRRLDGWLRSRLRTEVPDLAQLGRWLAARGVTAVTDATFTNGPDELVALAAAGLPQRVTAMTADPSCEPVAGVALGPVKIVLDESDLPPLDALGARVRESHAARRHVAIHCVDAASLVLALSCGTGPGDRIEHASVVTEDLIPLLVSSGVTVVVQPGLVTTKGDRYLAETDRCDHPHLYRLASLLAAGIPVIAGSDAPYGPLDPWTTIAGATLRRTPSGTILGSAESVDPLTAVRLSSADTAKPAFVERLTGRRADLVALDDDWDRLARHPEIALTMIDGTLVHTTLADFG
jgi:predicted amidohydrolase YtcJ